LKALEEKRYLEAEQTFLKATAAAPEDYGAHFNLALARSLLGKPAEAIDGYRKVLELKPGLYEAELNLGILLLDRKETALAARHLEAAAGLKPGEFRPNYYLAEALLAAGQTARAEQHYRKAMQADPKSAAAELGLARAVAGQGRIDESAEHFRRASELDSGYRDALVELASLYEREGKLAEAIAVYQQFAAEPAVRERLGELLLRTGRLEEAIENLESAAQSSPSAANRFLLATAYLKGKKPEKALPVLEQAVQAEPESFDLRMMYGRTLRDLRKFQDAAREFLRCAQLKPSSKEAWSELAGMLILLENYPPALAALDRLEALGEQTAAVHYFRAIVLDRTRQYEPALASYEKFLALSGGANPDEEFKARQRVKVIQKELSKR